MKKFRRVLLISEDPICTYIHTSLIEKLGFAEETMTAANGKEACEKLAEECTNTGNTCPDLIFVDTYMQPMNGFEFLEEYNCLNLACSPKIILLSLDGYHKDEKRAKEFEGIGFFIKPLTAKSLEIIREETFGPLS